MTAPVAFWYAANASVSNGHKDVQCQSRRGSDKWPEQRTRGDKDEGGSNFGDSSSGREDWSPRGAVGDRLVDTDIVRRRARRRDRAAYMRAISI